MSIGFLRASQVTVSDFGQLDVTDNLNGLFINEDGITDGLAQLSASNIEVPIFCYGNGESSLPKSVLGRISERPSYAELMSALHRMEVVHSSRHAPTPHAKLKQILVGSSPAMRSVRQQIEQVANSEANVLILGESGTGKEVVASSLHYLSKRQDRQFVPVNCGAIPGDLLESELFGHEKGPSPAPLLRDRDVLRLLLVVACFSMRLVTCRCRCR